MSQSIFHVRPLDAGKGWAIDEYDGRGAWQSTIPKGPDGAPMDKVQAQRAVFQLRRKAVNSAPRASPVNNESAPCSSVCAENPEWVCTRTRGHAGRHEGGGGDWHDGSGRQRTTSDVACADVASSTDPRVLIKVAHQHWWGIGWPEDEKPIALLERAMELLKGAQ